MALITLRRVSMIYFGNGPAVTALSEINLDVEQQEFVTVVGPTGCGKTTLLRIVAGLIQPTMGTAWRGGELVRGPSARVGLVFQRPALLPWRTVGGNLSLPMELTGLSSLESVERIEELLQATGLDHYRHAYPREISAGMQQIVSFCMALILDPDVLLMDEPFGALDALTRERLSESLLDLWSCYRKTVLFVTHSILEAVFLADRVVVLSSRPGRVLASVPIPLPRPRTLALMETLEFLDLTTQVRRVLELQEGG